MVRVGKSSKGKNSRTSSRRKIKFVLTFRNGAWWFRTYVPGRQWRHWNRKTEDGDSLVRPVWPERRQGFCPVRVNDRIPEGIDNGDDLYEARNSRRVEWSNKESPERVYSGRVTLKETEGIDLNGVSGEIETNGSERVGLDKKSHSHTTRLQDILHKQRTQIINKIHGEEHTRVGYEISNI